MKAIKKALTLILTAAMLITGLPGLVVSADDTVIRIRSFSAIVKEGAAKNGSGDYVWTANTNASDHRYTFRVSYSLSGTCHAPKTSDIEKR